MKNPIKKMLFSEEQIKTRVKELGRQITKDYKDKNLFIISVLKGSIVFTADLIRAIDLDIKIDFMSVSTFNGGLKSTGVVKFLKDLDQNIEGYDVIIVEDILDSGLTLNYIRNMLIDRHPKTLKIVALLDKVEKRAANIKADYVGFDIPDEFIIGYGLDYQEYYRNLPYIGILNI